MTSLLDRTSKATANLQKCLSAYAECRNNPYVGQFLDDEGARDGQFGVYGMAAWIAMTQDHQLAQQVAVSKLREQCRDKLCELVNPPTGGQQDPHENERIHELRCVAPKIVFAIEALTQFDTSRDAVAELRQRLLKARRDDGSWDFIVQGDATPGNCFVTSLVLRTIATDNALSDAEQCARHYLEKKQSDIKGSRENKLIKFSFVAEGVCNSSRHES